MVNRRLQPIGRPTLHPRISRKKQVALTKFHTSPGLARALAERDYRDPTPVQNAVLKEEIQGRDLLVSAQTGSGKTVAYGLALEWPFWVGPRKPRAPPRRWR